MVKKQINVVNLTPFEKESNNENHSNEMEGLNQIKEEIAKEETKVDEPPEQKEEIVEEQQQVKPKKKAAPRKKKPETPEPTPTPEQLKAEPGALELNATHSPEPEPEPTLAKKVKTVELVKCQKCEKEMTKRTLRYDHEKTCPGEPVVREAIPVKRRAPIKKDVEKKPEAIINIPNEVIEEEIKKRLQNTAQERLQQRLKLKEEKIKKLATQIA